LITITGEEGIVMSASSGNYYLPNPSPWPIITSAGLFTLALGFALFINNLGAGPWLMLGGASLIIYMMFRWFGQVIGESEAGTYNQQVDLSFRWGMSWFIFSEVMFFAAFFGALFYARQITLPLLGTDDLLWPGFDGVWPTSGPKGNPFTPMSAWGIPAINTLILLTSGATVTWAHWGLLKNNRSQLVVGLILTVALGISFITLQAYEYAHAYKELGLTLKTGIYGATFFMLTGFHGFHVTMGTIMLFVILMRSIAGHFKPDNHFGFEAVAWYWHFVDVVWLGLFIFVYWV
jgi:cytochrome c oxidase subunit 3